MLRLQDVTLASEWWSCQKLNSRSADSCLVLRDFYAGLRLAFKTLQSQSPASWASSSDLEDEVALMHGDQEPRLRSRQHWVQIQTQSLYQLCDPGHIV